jgi:DNA-binding LytR/AlgR family response regulator
MSPSPPVDLQKLMASLAIHRGTIVNLRAIEQVERDVPGRCLVHLKEHADVLPVSRTFAGQFKQM